MAVKVYIDGQEGTTGLRIIERFSGRNDIELLKIDPEKDTIEMQIENDVLKIKKKEKE